MFKKLLFSLLFSMAAFTSNAQSIGMIGGFNNWSGDVVMNTTDNVNFSLTAYTFTLSTELKFRQDGAWAISWGGATFPSGIAISSPQNIKDVPAGTFDISFNITTGAFLFTPVSLGFDNIGIYGGFNAWGTAEPMITTDGIDYSKTDFHYTAADVKFIKDNDATMTWGGTTFPAGAAVAGGTAIPLMHGFYNTNFNKNTLAYSFIEVPVTIIGNGIGGWGDADEIAMTSTDGGINFTLTGQTIAVNGGDSKVKFRANSSWANNWGGTDFPTGTGVSNGPDNIPATPGVYDISFNRITGAYSFVLVSATVDNYGITGAFNTAATAVAMNVDATGNDYHKNDVYYSAPNVHFIKDNDAMMVYGGPGFPMGTATLGGGDIPSTVGYFNVTFKKDTGAYTFTESPIGMIGTAVGGWDDANELSMSSVDNGINLTYSNVVLVNGDMKFRASHNWDLSYGGSGFPTGVASSSAGNFYAVAGTYNVSFNRLTGEYSFADPAAATTTFDKNVVSVYPNPTSNVWNFKTNNTQVSSIAIADISGKIVMTKNIMASEFAIDASTFASGLYFATIKVGDKTNTVKIIKK